VNKAIRDSLEGRSLDNRSEWFRQAITEKYQREQAKQEFAKIVRTSDIVEQKIFTGKPVLAQLNR